MKKISILLVSLALAIPSFAQDNDEPNRLLLTNSIGNTQGYVLDRVQDISFARVDGEVKANVEIFDVECDMLSLSVMKTEACGSFKLDILPATIANVYNDLTIITYINNYSSPTVYYEDFPTANLTGIELQPATDYVLVTVGIDRYGVEDGVVRVPFTTPSIPVKGNPEVAAEVVDRQLTSFSVKFTPNDDVMSYYCVAGEKGTLQSQFEMFAPMMGLTSFTDMIMSWGLERFGENVVEWTGMAPNTEYEVYYVALDKDRTPADYQCIEVSTLALGGDGEASVTIELGKYEYADWYGEMQPSQYISFIPNEEASCYRFNVYLAETYDPKADEIKDELRTDPPMPTAYWFFYDPITTDYQINPNTECVAIAAAKNGNGEWGEVVELRFTTPAEADGKPAGIASAKDSGKNLKSRIQSKKTSSFSHQPGKAPEFVKAKKLQLK